MAVLFIEFPKPETLITVPPEFDTSTRPLVGVPIVRFAPVNEMPVSQELLTVVSPDTIGQEVCAWTPAMAMRVDPTIRAICLMAELITNFVF